MNINYEVPADLERELQYFCMELDLITCQEGQCIKEPEHWTPSEVALAILREYLRDFRVTASIRPVPSKVWKYIIPKTGRTEPQPSLFEETVRKVGIG